MTSIWQTSPVVRVHLFVGASDFIYIYVYTDFSLATTVVSLTFWMARCLRHHLLSLVEAIVRDRLSMPTVQQVWRINLQR